MRGARDERVARDTKILLHGIKVVRRSKVCLLFRTFLIVTKHPDSLLERGIDQNVREEHLAWIAHPDAVTP